MSRYGYNVKWTTLSYRNWKYQNQFVLDRLAKRLLQMFFFFGYYKLFLYSISNRNVFNFLYRRPQAPFFLYFNKFDTFNWNSNKMDSFFLYKPKPFLIPAQIRLLKTHNYIFILWPLFKPLLKRKRQLKQKPNYMFNIQKKAFMYWLYALKLLLLMLIQKSRRNTNGIRIYYKIIFTLIRGLRPKTLTFYPLKPYPTCNSKRIKCLRTKSYTLNTTLIPSSLGFICSWNFCFLKNLIFVLIETLSGSFFYLPQTSKQNLFTLVGLLLFPLSLLTLPIWQFCFLFQFSPHSPLSFLKASPDKPIKYIRSAGCNAKLFFTNLLMFYSLIKLPSTKFKYFSPTALALPTKITAPYPRHYLNKASKGYWIRKNLSVRGVAKNPVDHPHGGRTKTILSPKTPWGLTAKKNK